MHTFLNMPAKSNKSLLKQLSSRIQGTSYFAHPANALCTMLFVLNKTISVNDLQSHHTVTTNLLTQETSKETLTHHPCIHLQILRYNLSTVTLCAMLHSMTQVPTRILPRQHGHCHIYAHLYYTRCRTKNVRNKNKLLRPSPKCPAQVDCSYMLHSPGFAVDSSHDTISVQPTKHTQNIFLPHLVNLQTNSCLKHKICDPLQTNSQKIT